MTTNAPLIKNFEFPTSFKLNKTDMDFINTIGLKIGSIRPYPKRVDIFRYALVALAKEIGVHVPKSYNE